MAQVFPPVKLLNGRLVLSGERQSCRFGDYGDKCEKKIVCLKTNPVPIGAFRIDCLATHNPVVLAEPNQIRPVSLPNHLYRELFRQ
jgi:hypothetical protein